MSKSACSTLNNLVKLILIFSKTASKENIQNYINPKQMAQIISKLLDTKYEPYVYDLISILEIFLSKIPEHFIKNLIREGIIENIKNFEFKQNKSSDNPKKKIKKEKKEKKEDKDKENDSFSDILDNENNDNNEYSDGYVDMEIENQNDEENEEQIESGNEDEIIPMDIEIKDLKEDKNKDNNKDNKNNKDKDKDKDNKDKDNKENKDKDKDKDTKAKKELKLDDNKKEKDLSSKFFEKEKLLKELLEKTKKIKNKEYELLNKNNKILLEGKIKELIANYLTDEKIKSYLEKLKFTELINLKETLIKLEKELKDACDKKDNYEIKNVLQKIIKILSEPKNEITLFELENSKILMGLCNYFEPIFQSQYDKLNIENDSELQKHINLNDLLPSPLTKNDQIFDKTKLFLECLTENKNKLINYIKLLEYSITSMNCFTMMVNDDSTTNYNLNVYYNQTMRNVKKYDLRVIYSDSSFKEKIENNKTIDDPVFKEKLIEYNTALKVMKEVKFLLSEGSVVDDMSSVLLSNTNVTFVANENYDVTLVYFLNLKNKNVTEKFDIDENWGIRDLKKELLKKYGRVQGPLYFNSPIYFGLNFKKKEKKEEKEKEKEEEKKPIK